MDTNPENAVAPLASVKYLLKYAWVPLLSMLGGMASYFHRISQHRVAFTALRLTSEILVSGFVGVLVYLLCRDIDMSSMHSAVFVGIGGHMGNRGMWFLEGKFLGWMRDHNFMD